jgi:hypothetical protein
MTFELFWIAWFLAWLSNFIKLKEAWDLSMPPPLTFEEPYEITLLSVRQSQSQNYVTTDGSVGQSILVSSTHLGLTTRSLLLSDTCRLVEVGRSLWREDGSVVCHTLSAVIRLLSVCTIYMLQVIKCMYIQHIQDLCQFRLSTADHALSLVAPATTAV